MSSQRHPLEENSSPSRSTETWVENRGLMAGVFWGLLIGCITTWGAFVTRESIRNDHDPTLQIWSELPQESREALIERMLDENEIGNGEMI